MKFGFILLCLSCRAQDFNFQIDRSFIQGLGIEECEEGFYYNYISKDCQRCQFNCEACFGMASNCTSCVSDYQFLMPDSQFDLQATFPKSAETKRRLFSQMVEKYFLAPPGAFDDGVVEETSIPPPDYLIQDSTHGCHFCQEIQNTKLSDQKDSCDFCSHIEGCQTCLDKNKCLKCEEGKVLDLTNFMCKDTCENIQIELFDGFSTCQENLEFFVDSNSEQEFEFGTKQYPYKNIFSATKHIFNSIGSEQREVKILLEQSAEFWSDTASEPLVFGGLGDIKILPYSKNDEDITLKPTLGFNNTLNADKNSTRNFPDSVFNFQAITQDFGEYKIEERLKLGELTEYNLYDLNGNLQELKTAHFFSTTATFDGLRITSENQREYLFYAYYSLTNVLTIKNCVLDATTSQISTNGGHEVHFLDNQVNVKGKWGIVLNPNTLGNECQQDLPQNGKYIMKRNKIKREYFGTWFSNYLIFQEGKTNLTISENKIIDMTGRGFGSLISLQLDVNEACSFPGSHTVTIDNNHIEGMYVEEDDENDKG